MKEILQKIIENLVENKEEVSINQKDEENSTIFEVKVAEADMGKVIGKQGRMAKSIRTIMKAVAIKENKKVQIEFIG